ncbi:MAG: hypothetical protein AAGC63_11215 [Propionicimonas sp.]|nr:hypothetical protein [Propionicimonas sp.]
MFAYPVPDRDHERLVHDLEVLAQMTPSKPVRKPARGRRILRLLPRSTRIAAVH